MRRNLRLLGLVLIVAGVIVLFVRVSNLGSPAASTSDPAVANAAVAPGSATSGGSATTTPTGAVAGSPGTTGSASGAAIPDAGTAGVSGVSGAVGSVGAAVPPTSGSGAGSETSPSPIADSMPADLGPHVRGTEAVVLPPDELTGYVWPLPRGLITLPFGPTPWGGSVVDGELFHDGVDMATVCGDRIVAAHAGTVLAASRHFDEYIGWLGDLGPYEARLDAKHLWGTLPIVIVIDDGNGYRSIYAHFSQTVVVPGQVVKAGQLIGYEGATGRATGCHLHYSLFNPRDPGSFGIPGEVVKRMKVPAHQIARIDPLQVLPPRPTHAKPTGPAASPPLDQAGDNSE